MAADRAEAPSGPPAQDPERGRLARWLLPDGEEPDPRFTLANERTFLAWIRTSLAFIGGGVALEAFVQTTDLGALRTGVALALVAVGIVVALNAGLRWLRVERAIRRGRPLPVTIVVPLVVLALAIGGVAALLVTWP